MDIEVTIDRFENDNAVLKTKDGDTVIWPKNKLPAEAKEGKIFIFSIMNEEQKEADKKELAKNILNEILSSGEDKK